MPSASAPARMKSAAVSRFTPPVGIIGTWGRGPLRALIYLAPPTEPQGNIFTKSLPAFHAVITSVGVRAPAMISFPARFTKATVSASNPGLTMNSAPASMQRCAVSASRTVPAPISTCEELLRDSCAITSIAPGTVIVISTMGIPPAQTPSTARRASRAEDARTTGTTPISIICLRVSSRVMLSPCLDHFSVFV